METIVSDIRPTILTVDALDNMKPDTIFAHGYMEHLHPWFNNIKRPYLLSTATGMFHEIAEELPKDVALDRIALPNSKYRLVKWLAIRGAIHDWAIYHSMDGNLCQHDYFDCDCHLLRSWEEIENHGAKLRIEQEIRSWVPCTDEAFNLYRY